MSTSCSLWPWVRGVGPLQPETNMETKQTLTTPRTCLAVDEEQPRPRVGSNISQAKVHVVALGERVKLSLLLLWLVLMFHTR